ncbi:MAG: acyl CoA:acetate/3-ketoacid CoA transferase, partial [Gammaproteobacteria bacterium]|nr:acyl CoA:acetate/3-ketoacid CoA transferase [Gammaproteobacteria bacterium]
MVQKIISPEDAISLIRDGDTVAISGFVGIGTPEELIIALEKRFLETGHPRDLTLVFAAAPGDGGERGVNRLAHEGLVKRAVGGHWSLVPKLSAMAVENKIEAYNLPLGCVSQLFRVIAGGKPGLRTKVGLRTFVDPRISGGKISESATEDLVHLDTIRGQEWLFYKAFPIDVCLLRGTTADAHGNVTSEREALELDVTSIAMAAHNSDGVVIVQVERIAMNGSLAPKNVLIPGALVDCVVRSKPENHHQTFGTPYEHAFSGEMRVPLEELPVMPLDERKIMARRAVMELPIGGVVNLGIGIPEGLAKVAAEEGLLDQVTLSAEAGTIGGMPQGGLDFGASLNPDAIIATNTQFDFYDGGGLDMACLGMAQADKYGNVNVSKFGKRLAGAGGFINISQNASRLVLTGSFTAGGLQVAVEDGKLRIVQEGKVRKFVDQVEHITFSGDFARETGQPVLYVTERCVFSVGGNGMELIEVAPGIDVENDILAHMDFMPYISNVRPMDARIFQNEMMGIKQARAEMPMDQRISLDHEQGRLIINLRSLKLTSRLEILQIKQRIEEVCESFNAPVEMMAFYDGFEIKDSLQDEYTDMISSIDKRLYKSLVHYTRDPFIRLKFGAELRKRQV